MFDLFEDTYTWVFIAFNLVYGLSTFFIEWNDFGTKFINIVYLIAFIVFVSILFGEEGFIEGLGVALAGGVASWLGLCVGDELDDDFHIIFLLVSIPALIAMFIILGNAI